MNPQTQTLFDAALALPEAERALLVERLLESLSPESDERTDEEFIQATAPNHRGDPMKVIGLQEAQLETCVREAQGERIVLTRNGKPVALLVGVEGMDLEQIELGHSDKFWFVIRERRRQKTLRRAELEKRLANE
jgi:antitoxin (DNA-binding transcriptional repressor) of toxin-antitoxin stability system